MPRQGPAVCFCEHGDGSQVLHSFRPQLHPFGTLQNKTPTAQTSTCVTHAQLLTLHLSASRDSYTIAIIYGLHCAKQCGTAASTTINNLSQVRHTYTLQSRDVYYQQFLETKCNPNYCTIFDIHGSVHRSMTQ
jgi:hypothetical protein